MDRKHMKRSFIKAWEDEREETGQAVPCHLKKFENKN